MLEASTKKFRKRKKKNKKKKKGNWMYNMIKKWYKQDKIKIADIKKSLKVLE